MFQSKTHRLRWSLSASILFVLSFGISTQSIIYGQTTDEAKIGALVEKYFAAYQKKDLDSLTKMWSDKAADFTAYKETLQKTFAENSQIEIKNLVVRKIVIDGEKASIKSVVELSAIDVKTSKPASGFGKKNFTLRFLKEREEWKVSQFLVSEEELASAIAQATTEEQRKTLLEADKELITNDLSIFLYRAGRELAFKMQYEKLSPVIYLAMDIGKRFDNKKIVSRSLFILGFANERLGNIKQALSCYLQSQVILEELDDKVEIANIMGNICGVYVALGDYTKASEACHRGLKIAEELKDNEAIARALLNLGVVYQSQNNYAAALEVNEKSLALADIPDNENMLALLFCNIGDLYLAQGNYRKALYNYQNGLSFGEKTGFFQGIVAALGGLGSVHKAQNNYAQALNYFQKGLKVAEDSKRPRDTGMLAADVGSVYELLGNDAEALKYYKQGLKFAEDLGEPLLVADILSKIGAFYQTQHQYAKAMEYYQKSLHLIENVGDKDVLATLLGKISILYELQSNYVKSLELAEKSIIFAKDIQALESLWVAQLAQGKAYRGLKNNQKAIQSFIEAIHTIEKLREQLAGGEQDAKSFFEQKSQPYFEIVDMLVNQNQMVEALAYAERLKGRVVLDVMQGGKVNVSKAMTSQELDSEKKLYEELVSLNAQISHENQKTNPDESDLANLNVRLQKARLDYESFHTNLYALHPELKVQRGQMQPISLKEADNLIPSTNTALIEYVVKEDKVFLFLIRKKDSVQSSIPEVNVFTIDISQKVLAGNIERFTGLIANRNAGYKESAYKLYELLLKPAQAQLHNVKNLIIVPDGVLWKLPFQAMQSSSGRFLLQDYAISYAPSLTVLREMTRQEGRPQQSNSASQMLLAVGNPDVGKETSARLKEVYMNAALEPLPEAERQVKALREMYGASQSKIYLGVEAKEERIKQEAGHYKILHLATHGILNDASPMYSHLVLSQTKGAANEDGLLEAWEIMRLNLNVNLAVLSACDTAGGRVGAGEGVIGLSWALFVAGCPAAVVSQWKVESSSTTALMLEFHRQLRASARNPRLRISKAEALRQAALKLLKSREYKHPFYWAAFVVIGNNQ
jgi:CHAT domain-containing protein